MYGMLDQLFRYAANLLVYLLNVVCIVKDNKEKQIDQEELVAV